MIRFVGKIEPKAEIIDLGNKYTIDPNYIFGGAWITHYQNKYYRDLFNTLINVCKDTANYSYNINAYNLIINSDFKHFSLFWKFWDNHFLIDGKTIQINESNNTECIYAQIWSNDVVVRTDKEYLLSFDYKIHSDVAFSDDVIMVVRTFSRQNRYNKDDCEDQIQIRNKSEKRDEFIHREIRFMPGGAFVSIGAYIMKNGHVEWKNIMMTRTDMLDLKNENLIEKLIKNDLMDMNFVKSIN